MVLTKTGLLAALMEGLLSERIPSDGFGLERVGVSGLIPEVHHALPPFDYTSFHEGDGTFSIDNLDYGKVSEAGFDLRVGEHVFLADRTEMISGLEELLGYAKSGDIQKLEPTADNRFVLEPDREGSNIYYVVSHEVMRNFPSEFSLFIDAKSTTGRVGVMCTDVSKKALASLKQTPIITAVQPYVFPIEIEIGQTSLVQAILRNSDSPYMTKGEILEGSVASLFEGETEINLSENGRLGENGLLMTYSTHRAFKSKSFGDVPGPINMDVREEYDWNDFFEVLEGNGRITLDSKGFYLFGTRERILLREVCGILSRETYDTGTGLWGHFAGVIHPGFQGDITMECRASSNRVIREGDPAGFVRLDKLEGFFDLESGGYDGAYKGQNSPQLPKMFKSP